MSYYSRLRRRRVRNRKKSEQQAIDKWYAALLAGEITQEEYDDLYNRLTGAKE